MSGYVENTQQLDVTAHRSQHFELTPTRLGDYAGDYRLTITGSCPAGLPELSVPPCLRLLVLCKAATA